MQDVCDGLWIDAANRQITQVVVSPDHPIHHWVGGTSGIQVGAMLGRFAVNILYVPDAGLYDPTLSFFRIKPDGQPLRGNGLLLGPESGGAPTLTSQDLIEQIEFMSWAEVLAWVHAQAERPAMQINGETIMTWAEFWREIPPPAAQATS
jgi:hypothetical protein